MYFALRTGVVRIGQDNILRDRSSRTVLVGQGTSSNTVRNIKNKCPEAGIYVLKDTLPGELLGRDNIKIVGLSGSKLETAISKILKNMGNQTI